MEKVFIFIMVITMTLSMTGIAHAEGSAHAHPPCGSSTCTDTTHDHDTTAINYVSLGTTEGGDFDGTAYYLENDLNLTSTLNFTQTNKTEVYLCLNGHTITADGDFDAICAKNCTIVLCDCQGGGKITHSEGKTGRGAFVGNSSGGIDGVQFIMYGGEISGNTTNASGSGAGVGVYSNHKNNRFVMYGGKICNNTANKGNGGGVASAKAIIYGGEISNNQSNSTYADIYHLYQGGGGVSADHFEMYGGKIINNSCKGRGGGVRMNDEEGSFLMQGGEISGNTSDYLAGGVYFAYNIPAKISGNAKVTGNTGADGNPSNVYIRNDHKLTLKAPLGDEASIGVTTVTEPTENTPVVYMVAADGQTIDDQSLAATFSDKGFDTLKQDDKTAVLTFIPDPTPIPEDGPIPETGDGNGPFVFAGLLLLSMLGMTVLKKSEQV